MRLANFPMHVRSTELRAEGRATTLPLDDGRRGASSGSPWSEKCVCVLGHVTCCCHIVKSEECVCVSASLSSQCTCTRAQAHQAPSFSCTYTHTHPHPHMLCYRCARSKHMHTGKSWFVFTPTNFPQMLDRVIFQKKQSISSRFQFQEKYFPV